MVSVTEILALLYPAFLFLNGAVGLSVKYVQWKKYSFTEVGYTFVGLVFGILGLASTAAMFHYEYGMLPSRLILLATSLHMVLRPLRHKKWAALLSVGIGAFASYGAIKYWGPYLGEFLTYMKDYLNLTWFLDPLQVSVLVGLLIGALLYPLLKFLEDLLGTTSNIMDHWVVAIPLGVLGIIEGVVTGVPPHYSLVHYALVVLVGG